MTDIAPMLASVGTELPTAAGWVFEPKYDGIRILAFASGKKVSLVTRNGLDKTKQFPEIADAALELSRKAKRAFVIDGEVVAMRGGSPARFQELQGRMHVKDRSAIERHRDDAPAALFVFDMLVDGKTSLVTEPWRVRRKHLAALLQPPGGRSSALRLSDVSEDGQAMLTNARKHDWEGVIAKRADAPYEAGRRSRNWLKLKIERRQEFVVGGWTEPRNSREHIGAILLGYYNADGELIYAGHTGTGFTRESLASMYATLSKTERKSSPFSTTPKTNQPAHWVRPAVVVEVKFNEWTADGKLRQPVFLGVRDDKAASEVRREPVSGRVRAKGARVAAASVIPTKRAKRARGGTSGLSLEYAPEVPRLPFAALRVARDDMVRQIHEIESAGGDGVLETPTGPLEISNLSKIYFPATKHTKGDVMRFYAQLAPFILPAINDRPLVMRRFPNGIKGKAFYQQKAPADAPESVRVERVSDEGMTTAERLVGGDLATLLYIVQLGAISIDPWHSRVQSVQAADYSIIDLDPGPRAPFARVVEVAHEVKNVLDELKLRAIPKTSGASGMHIVLPLPPGVPNDGARMIAELVAARVSERVPKLATIERWVNARAAGAVYVDFLQNIRGKTVAGVYSVRAQPRATVSTPLDWSEVIEDLDPADFTIDTVPPRVAKLGDLWAKAMRKPNSLAGNTGGRRG
jgi:bifunctional non-homologous end joining protein LigD